MYDFFLAHANADSPQALALHELLFLKHKVFLDKTNLESGENWHKVLPEALQNSKVIVILLSQQALDAYYLHEEIARAIQHYRKNKNWCRMVPVYIDGFPADLTLVPYGLYQLHSLDLVQERSLEAIARKLEGLLMKDLHEPEEAAIAKEALTFKHALHQYPEGPMVDGHYIPTGLIEAIAEVVDDSLSLQVIYDANAFRKEADPTETGSILIKRVRLPNPNKNRPMEFWVEAFREARLHGPRMVAALLLSVEDRFFSKQAKTERKQVLETLKNIKP